MSQKAERCHLSPRKFTKPLDIFFEVYYNTCVVNAMTGNCPLRFPKRAAGRCDAVETGDASHPRAVFSKSQDVGKNGRHRYLALSGRISIRQTEWYRGIPVSDLQRRIFCLCGGYAMALPLTRTRNSCKKFLENPQEPSCPQQEFFESS